ncbi:NAD-dependent epimerase/dehydratase [Isosphaera pallida ATCC 43644]|uniref:NAD-dependent epimerase/dehydratase n=1 Tax=Isosphaera pallida (strain ATCC 43644 / DSM 9630 / IS1B) TaxID=575540 RepID=E8QYI5_ISOPI|nr:NAD-dependent epimerase/dehydratase family protein [Isosphaera pallida]ADV64168.1 NAD-dependent epimerase/dehydratase [Isosphaera pallida ATCC 43644]
MAVENADVETNTPSANDAISSPRRWSGPEGRCWLVTGASGFVGRHVMARLVECTRGTGAKVVGQARRGGWGHLVADLCDPVQARELIHAVQPDRVIHAAGLTPPASPFEFYRVNLLATLNLLEALREWGQPCRVVAVGSAAELGPVPKEALPVAEDWVCRPATSYGLSKWLAGLAIQRASPPIAGILARAFNPIGPGLPESQALGRFARRLADATQTQPDPRLPVHLEVGDLETRRDFLDVRDLAEALRLLADRGDPGEHYHVGTGRSHSIREGLEALAALAGRQVTWTPRAGPRPTTDPSNPRDSRAAIDKLVARTGWVPAFSWEQSLEALWREVQRRRGGPPSPEENAI